MDNNKTFVLPSIHILPTSAAAVAAYETEGGHEGDSSWSVWGWPPNWKPGAPETAWWLASSSFPEKCSVGGEWAGVGAGANKFSQCMKGGGPAWWEGAGGKINVRIDPPPPPWVVLSTIWNVLSEKQNWKLIAIFNFQFLDFDPPKTEKLSHATDCNIVGEANLPFDFSPRCWQD